MKKTKKADFTWNGYKFKNIPLVSWNNGLSYYSRMGAVSKVCKQYIKQKYNTNIQVATESYTGGSSLRVYVDPTSISADIFKLIKGDVQALFAAGSFNGMEDIYEYHKGETINFDLVIVTADNVETDNIDFTAKYVFVNHDFKYGTKQFNEYHNMEVK